MSAGAPLLTPWLGLTVRRWRIGLSLFLGVIGLGTAFVFLTRPIYRSEAALRLGSPPPSSGVNPSGGILSFLQLGGDPFANDLELLGSRSLAEAVVGRQALNVSLEAPRHWHRDSLLLSVEASRVTTKARYNIRHLNSETLELRRTSPTDSSLGMVTSGTPVSFGGATLSFRAWREGMPREFEIATVPFRTATRLTRSALEFQRPRREANVVTVAYDHPDPGVAEGVVSAAVDEFIRLRTELQHRESTQSADSLRTVAEKTKRELLVAEEALEEFQRTRRLVAPAAQSEAMVERQAELLAQVGLVKAELRGVEEMLNRLESAQDPSSSWTALLGYPAFLQNQTLGSMLLQLTTLQETRRELATRRTSENVDLRVVDEQIAYLDQSLRETAREYRAGLVDQIESLEPQLRELDALLQTLPGEALELGRMQREAQLLSEVLLLTEQRLRQEELREALTYANVQVVDPPALRDRPIWPRKKLGLAVVFLLASGSSLLGMLVRDTTDPVLRKTSQLQAILGESLRVAVGPLEKGASVLDDSVREALIARIRSEHPAGELALVPLGADAMAVALSEAGVGFHVHHDVTSFREAAGVASRDRPAVLVLAAGRTRTNDVQRNVRLIEEAGGSVLGAVLVCRTEAELSWALE